MPRDDVEDLYPEEVHLVLPPNPFLVLHFSVFLMLSSSHIKIESSTTPSSLHSTFQSFYTHALHLRQKYASQITLLIGFESDWIRPSSLSQIQALRVKYPFDIIVGSVHHVESIPIDFNKELYDTAIVAVEKHESIWTSSTTSPDQEREEGVSVGEERLFEVYFDHQYDMLKELKPHIVGHFDLIRLLSTNHARDLREWKGVWRRIIRNIELIAEYGGLVELNSAGIRKGLGGPYPGTSIVKVCIKKNIYCLRGHLENGEY